MADSKNRLSSLSAEPIVGVSEPAHVASDEARWLINCRRFALATTCIGLVLSALGLVGWLTGHWELAGGIGNNVPMAPAAALSLLFFGSALIVHLYAPELRYSRTYLVAVAFLVGLWGAVRLAELMAGHSLGIESYFIGDQGTAGDVPRGYMTPLSGVSFVLVGLTLLLMVRSYRLHLLAGLMPLLIITINLWVLWGYVELPWEQTLNPAKTLKTASVLYRLIQIPPAIPTAFAFLAFGIALILDQGPQHFLFRHLVGSSTRAWLLRGFLPRAAVFVVVSTMLGGIFAFTQSFDLSVTLLTIWTMAAPVIVGLLLSRIALQLGGVLDRSELERQKALVEQLSQAKTSAEKANRVKGEFLANMSHELRTPLAIIKLQAEELQEQAQERGDKELLAAVQTILDAGHRQRMLIDGILDLGKIEAGKIDFSLEKFELTTLLHDVAAAFRPLAAKKLNTLKVEAPEQPGSMFGDSLRIRQCIDNLLSNACKFTEKGTVTLRLERDKREGKDWIAFHIQDTGIGMSPRERQKLFRAFVQADASTTRRFGGTGLGLVITRNLCQMMGGDVTVTSEKGVGSTFTMRIPAEINMPKAETGSWDSKHGEKTPSPDNRPRLLVIDDEPMVQELLARFLSKEGFAVITARNGEEGLRMAREVHPAAVTLDVLMPGMDGWTVLLAMKTDPVLADIPVIMLTIVDDKSQGYALGASDYVTKPIDRQRLLSVLRKHCNVRAPGLSLLVEDDPEIRGLLRRALENEGWTVTEAGNGREGLDQAVRQRPDVILLDLLMPVMDGFEFVQELRRKDEWREIPIVVLTAKDLSPEERQWLNGQVSRILKKDCSSRDELLRHVANLLASQLRKQPQGPAKNPVPVH